MATTQPPNPKRRWYQFSLRTLLIGVTVVTVAFGGFVQYMRYWAGVNRERVAVVEDAVAAIQEVGGLVASEYEERRPQTWLERQFDDPGGADDPVGVLNVVSVHLSGNFNLTDALLENLKEMKNLEFANFSSNPNITDEKLVFIEGLTSLQSLTLRGTKVTDAGLVHVERLTNLRNLYLENTNITDAGLKHLKGLAKLERLHLPTNVTDEGVEKLKRALPNCEIRQLWDSSAGVGTMLPPIPFANP